MVCVAAFIILCIIGVFVAFLSIFKRDIGRAYWKTFKKSLGCVGKKVTLQKCDTNFKDDVKNTLLKKVILKKPHLVKPLSITIEVVSVAIVLITAWSLVEVVKSGFALWTFGTCNVSHPSSCALGAEACSIDDEEPQGVIGHVGRWFEEWGEIFGAIPDRLKSWNPEEYSIEYMPTFGKEGEAKVIDIMDPGCSVCMQSYKNQLQDSEFIENHEVKILVYPIELPDGGYKFKNSGLIARYVYALQEYGEENEKFHNLGMKIMDRIFKEKDENGTIYQSKFNNEYSEEDARKTLEQWLKEWGLKEKEIKDVVKKTTSKEMDEILSRVKNIVEEKVHAKAIPTMIFNNKKHNGLYKN